MHFLPRRSDGCRTFWDRPVIGRRAIFVRAGLVLAACLTVLSSPPAAQAGRPAAARPADARVLTPGPPKERELSGGQSHAYQMALDAGQFMVVATAQRNIELVVTIADPAGRKIIETSLEEISTVAAVTGRYLLQVRARDTASPVGRYEISIEPLRPARAPDKARASGDGLLNEGMRLVEQVSTPSIREAIEKFSLALALFREAEYRPREALALWWIGDSYVRLNERQPARDYLNQALALARALDDKARQAAVLLSLGRFHRTAAEPNRALEYYDEALKFYEALHDTRGRARALTSAGIVFDELGESSKALE